jgi:hypothetical protein
MTKLVLSCNIFFTHLYLLKFYDILYVGTFEMQRERPWKKKTCFPPYLFLTFIYLYYLNTKGNIIFLVNNKATSFIWSPKFCSQRSWLHLWIIIGLRRSFFFTWSTSILKYKWNGIVYFTMLLPFNKEVNKAFQVIVLGQSNIHHESTPEKLSLVNSNHNLTMN